MAELGFKPHSSDGRTLALRKGRGLRVCVSSQLMQSWAVSRRGGLRVAGARLAEHQASQQDPAG